MKSKYEILIDEAEPGGICEQAAWIVNNTGGEVVETHNYQDMFTVLVAQWPVLRLIDGDLTYGFVHPLKVVGELSGVIGCKLA